MGPGLVGLVAPLLVAVWLLFRGDGGGPAPGPLSPREPEPRTDPPLGSHAHNGAFAALGRWTYRSRRWLPIVGLATVIGLNVWAFTSGGPLSQGGWQVPGSEAGRASNLLSDRFGEQATTLFVIFTDPDGDAASAEFQATVAEAVAPLADDPLVDQVLTFDDVSDPAFLSENGSEPSPWCA